MFGPDHEYAVGDDAWIYVGDHQGDMSHGKVVAVLDLPGWGIRNYVVEIDTPMDPLLEVRSASMMRPKDPRLTSMAGLLRQRFDLDPNVSQSVAAELLEIADGN